jgi:hypothetical protein
VAVGLLLDGPPPDPREGRELVTRRCRVESPSRSAKRNTPAFDSTPCPPISPYTSTYDDGAASARRMWAGFLVLWERRPSV